MDRELETTGSRSAAGPAPGEPGTEADATAIDAGEHGYPLASAPTEMERLQLQSHVWEPAGRALLAKLPSGACRRTLDVGCGVLGWLRILSEWVGLDGSVVGSDVDDRMLGMARVLTQTSNLRNVTLVHDDLFTSELAPGSFDLVHLRFQIAPLGRAEEQLAAALRLVRPGGWIVLEDPDSGSWRVNPDAAATARLIGLIVQGFRDAGGDFDAGRGLASLLRERGLKPEVEAEVLAMPAGHPYLRLPLQLAASMRPRLLARIGEPELDRLLGEAEQELGQPGTWGTTFTLIQAFATVAGRPAPMTRDEAWSFAQRWAERWNRLDLASVLEEFDDAVVWSSPKAVEAVGTPTVRGKEALLAYWKAALAPVTSLHFTVQRILWDAQTAELSILYDREVNGSRDRAVEILRFGEAGRVVSGEVHYGVVP